ncbi:MAG TPA: hypothetical protein VD862_02810 [Candidatus Paceibacterota bacterium]|nr:hypothetical protein [Candidatus Paceibacterota bacterium]
MSLPVSQGDGDPGPAESYDDPQPPSGGVNRHPADSATRIVIAQFGGACEGRVVGQGAVGIGRTPAECLVDMAKLYPNLFMPGTVTLVHVRMDPFLEE